ncbi:MAG TPA: hypothetical protein VFE58_08825 [Tepidisphaeraceae bacterium]|nr:hypothetical protein [Tepidisphaeraceae bacterium]
MKMLFPLAAALLSTGCTCHHPPSPATRISHDTPTTIYLTLAGQFEWNGWVASPADIPQIVSEHHLHSILLRAHKGAVISYQEALAAQSEFLSAGVKEVTLGPGGLADN